MRVVVADSPRPRSSLLPRLNAWSRHQAAREALALAMTSLVVLTGLITVYHQQTSAFATMAVRLLPRLKWGVISFVSSPAKRGQHSIARGAPHRMPQLRAWRTCETTSSAWRRRNALLPTSVIR